MVLKIVKLSKYKFVRVASCNSHGISDYFFMAINNSFVTDAFDISPKVIVLN
jgi:hypothetical protein